jgi:aspartyl-tRNA(Asn)/glutamyl-tRNA(Gln) amidotransferase subunit B
MPELPRERYQRFLTQYQLPAYDAKLLNADREISDYFEEAVKSYAGDPKRLSNWMLNEILRLMNGQQKDARELVIRPNDLAEIVRMADAGVISAAVGKQLIDLVQETGKPPKAIVKEQNLAMVSDDETIRELCETIVKAHPQEAAAYRAGKESLLAWFTGQLMRETRGKADAKRAGHILKELLGQ